MAQLIRQISENLAVREGVTVVRKVLAENEFPNGFKVQQLFELAVKEAPPAEFKPVAISKRLPVWTPKNASKKHFRTEPPPPPKPEHPIRSIKFLKTRVLPVLEGQNELKVIRQPRASAVLAEPEMKQPKLRKADMLNKYEFVWKVVDPSTIPSPPKPKGKLIYGTEVGVGADVSHLNKRRQAARVGKVSREVNKMKAFREERGLPSTFTVEYPSRGGRR